MERVEIIVPGCQVARAEAVVLAAMPSEEAAAVVATADSARSLLMVAAVTDATAETQRQVLVAMVATVGMAQLLAQADPEVCQAPARLVSVD